MYSIQLLTARRVLCALSRLVSFPVSSGSIVIVDMLDEEVFRQWNAFFCRFCVFSGVLVVLSSEPAGPEVTGCHIPQ